jgi:large subunit ribosomal protein L15
MKLDNLKRPKSSRKSSKRLGRGQGSGTGKTSGRGHKGAGQRSGHRERPWFEGGQMPLSRRLPKRGFSNNQFREEFQIVNIESLEKISVKKINASAMEKHGLVKSAFKPIKVLGRGKLEKAKNVTATAFSKSAIDKIEKSGGTVTIR